MSTQAARAGLSRINARRPARHGRFRRERAAGPLARWLQADPRDVVLFVSRPTAATLDAHDAPPLAASLQHWRRHILGARVPAIIRRWLMVAALSALALVLIDHAVVGLPVPVMLAVPLIVWLAGAAWTLRRAASLDSVARLLDARIGLREQLATALEEPGTLPRTGLAARLGGRAAALADQTLHTWTVRSLFAWREWALALALPVAALAVFGLPRPASNPVAVPAPITSPAVPTVAAPSAISLTVPAPPAVSTARLPIQLSVSLASTPVAPTAAPAKRGALAQATRAQVALHGVAAATAIGSQRVAVTPGKGVNPGHTAPGASLPPPATSGQPAVHQSANSHTSLPLLSDRHLFLPTGKAPQAAGNGRSSPAPAGTPARSGAASGSNAGVANRAVASNGQRQTRRGANGAVGQQGGANGNGGKIGAVASGLNKVPYGGQAPDPRQLAKPGLITGKSNSSPKNAAGSAAGHGQGATTGATPMPSRGSTSTSGRLNLQSGYSAGSGTSGRRTAPGLGGGATKVDTGETPATTFDYVPPDANAVDPGDRALVARYFAPRKGQ